MKFNCSNYFQWTHSLRMMINFSLWLFLTFFFCFRAWSYDGWSWLCRGQKSWPKAERKNMSKLVKKCSGMRKWHFQMDVNRIPNVDDVCWKLFRIVFWRFEVFSFSFFGLSLKRIIQRVGKWWGFDASTIRNTVVCWYGLTKHDFLWFRKPLADVRQFGIE